MHARSGQCGMHAFIQWILVQTLHMLSFMWVWRAVCDTLCLCTQAIPSFNSNEFSGGLVSQEDIGVLFRFIHSIGQGPNS